MDKNLGRTLIDNVGEVPDLLIFSGVDFKSRLCLS